MQSKTKISKTKQSAAVMNAGGTSTSSDDDENTFVENFFN